MAVEPTRGGQRIIKEGGKSAKDRLRFVFHLVTARQPEEIELEILTDEQAKFLAGSKGKIFSKKFQDKIDSFKR